MRKPAPGVCGSPGQSTGDQALQDCLVSAVRGIRLLTVQPERPQHRCIKQGLERRRMVSLGNVRHDTSSMCHAAAMLLDTKVRVGHADTDRAYSRAEFLDQVSC